MDVVGGGRGGRGGGKGVDKVTSSIESSWKKEEEDKKPFSSRARRVHKPHASS
jgi:hypothetical protein